MASHQHHHHCHPPATSSSYGCCHYYSTCCTPPPPDPHLHPMSSHIHLTPPQPHLYSPHLNPLHESFHPHHPYHHQTPYHPPPPTTHQQKQQEFPLQPTVSSLLRRIAALESSLILRRQQYSPDSAGPYHSHRDAAARIIQTHFRAFLVRRSRTLRQLKDLASIKSTLNALKSSLNHDARLDSRAISRRAMNLLLKLDSIRGGDPMIRDGKRSISRDIIRFMEFIDGVSMERNEIPSIALEDVRLARTSNKSRGFYDGQKIGPAGERVLMGKLEGQVEKIHGFSVVYEDDDDDEEGGTEPEKPRISINGKVGSSQNNYGGLKARGGVQDRVKKSVSFADNRNLSRVFSSTSEPISSGDTNSSDGSGSVDDEREIVDNLCSGVDKINGLSRESDEEEDAHTEDGGPPRISDGERRKPRRNLRAEDSYEMSGRHEGENGDFVFSAPMPVKMESRADLMKKRNAVKIFS